MKFLKLITIMLLIVVAGLKHSDSTKLDFLENYTTSAVTISNDTFNQDEYYSELTKLADDTEVILLNSRIEDGEINWYCIGSECDLGKNEYYTTYNDAKAKDVLPIKNNSKERIYSFEKLDSISTAHLNFNIIAKESNSIEEFQTSIEKIGLGVTHASGSEQLHSNPTSTVLIIGLIIMYLITLIATAKKYLLDKYNGKYAYEAIFKNMIVNAITCFVSVCLLLLIVYFELNNSSLFANQLIGLIFLSIFLCLIITLLEAIACIVTRTFGRYTILSNTLPGYTLMLLFVSTLSIAIIANIYVSKSSVNIVRLIQNAQFVPSSDLDNYYTYTLTFYGDGSLGFDYMENYVDPAHVTFYKETENKYSGIVTCFQNCPNDYSIVNENYLNYINRDIDIDPSKINLITSQRFDEIPQTVNQVITNDDTYPYISQDTGLIDTYTGPLVVINSSVIDTIDPTLVSTTLQSNNYFLKLEQDDINEINLLRNELDLEQNTSQLYPVTSISSDFATEQRQHLLANLNTLIISITLLIINLLMLIFYRFEIKRQRFMLEYIHGTRAFNSIKNESIIVLSPMILATLLKFNSYTIIFLLLVSILVIVLASFKYNNLIKNISNLMKE